MIPAKLATPGLLKIKVFWNKGSDVITFIKDATNIILSRSSNYIVDVVMWPNFDYSSIFMIEVITTQILKQLWGVGGRGKSIWLTFCGLSNNVSSKERVKPWFCVTFNIIIDHIFPENFIEIPQFFQEIWKISPSILAIFIISLLQRK